MLYWALVFFIIAIIAAFFGFGGVAATAASIAQILFFVFLVIFLIALLMGWPAGGGRRSDGKVAGEGPASGPSPGADLIVGGENPSKLAQGFLVTLIGDLSKVAGKLQTHPLARTD